ncbi:MAG: molybdopterin-guanine dinucleotide biosynthesis protein B [Desulfamplus sp.]|nr:molybdopterin-guanine dinucleotide biosynthesis protein B [Desulfamplus sp.]MBF0388797.1 molybdopterin-guanine dinucleotide biosynthesis protein B [Desulfamplus sp.]
MHLPPIISIVSKKRAGKTTLIVKLIPELKNRGYRVGTLKHDTHGFDIDHEGKDTYKHKEAGSDTVVISSPWKISIIKDVSQEMSVDEVLKSYFLDVDIVITEGYKKANKLQIEVFRKGAHEYPMYKKGDKSTTIAIASDTPLDVDIPIYNINDIKAIADLIESKLLLKPL